MFARADSAAAHLDGVRYTVACSRRCFSKARARNSCRVPRGKTASLVRSTVLPRGADRSHAAEVAGGRWAGANGILAPARGEVAEPGLRRTPGERVNSEGFRGFKSPPLRHPVRHVSLLFWRSDEMGAWGAIHTQPWTRRMPMTAAERKSRAKFSVGDFGRSILRTDRHVARTMYSKRNSTRVFSPA